jgi:retron-type reverse transcriptase
MTHRTGPPSPQPDDLLHRIASEEALWTAWDEVRLARGAPGVDGVSVRDFNREAPAAIARLARELVARRYRPRPLRRVWVRRRGKENEFRALAIPTVRDRVAAGAAHAVLEHRFEPLFHDNSFGFRRGRGTLAALRRVLRLRNEGYSDAGGRSQARPPNQRVVGSQRAAGLWRARAVQCVRMRAGARPVA